MNRCLRLASPRAHTWGIGLITSLVFLGAAAYAQQSVRPFPAAALRGTMQITMPPEMILNGQRARLSPGARIRGVNNLLVLSGSLVGQNLVVNYVRDSQGLVHEVWLLNATEAQQKMPGAPAQNNYGSETYAPTAADTSASGSTTPQH